MPEPERLVDRLVRGVRLDPGRIALRVGEDAWTYGQLHERAVGLAGALAGTSRVGVLSGPGAAPYVGLLGALAAGACAVPLHAGFPVERTVAMLDAAGVTAVVAARPLEAVRRVRPDVRWVSPDASGDGVPAADGFAYAMFTSGSTGRPKGVPITHANVLHFLDVAQEHYRLGPDDVVAQTFEPTFDLFLFGLFLTWGAGGTVVATPPSVLRRLPEFVNRHGITLWFSVPSTIRVARRLGLLTPGALPTLTRSLFCGEALRHDDAAAWAEAAPSGPVHNLYGPTELTIACTTYEWRPDVRGPNGLVPIGHPYAGLRHLVTDDAELCVTGPQMFGGYLDPADDAGRFLERDGLRWYRTGDRVCELPGVGLAYLGRVDHQTKVRGYRVELLEIEHALRQIEGVRDGAVVAVDVDGETALAAWYTGDEMPNTALLKALADHVPEYMVPRWMRHLTELPLNPNGKVDRTALVRHAAELA
jgi:amino acid adenylation domain-containing protein